MSVTVHSSVSDDSAEIALARIADGVLAPSPRSPNAATLSAGKAQTLQRELGWDHAMLKDWYVAATEAAALLPNLAQAEGRFERLLWTWHVGLKLLANWGRHRQDVLGSHLLDPSWIPARMLQPEGKGPLWRLHRLVDEEVRSPRMLSFPYLSGFEASLTLEDLTDKEKKLYVALTHSYLNDPDAFVSPMGREGLDLLRATHKLVARRYPDAEPAFRRQITKTVSVPSWLREVFPELLHMGLFLQGHDLE